MIDKGNVNEYWLLILVCLFEMKYEKSEGVLGLRHQFLNKFPNKQRILEKLMKKCGQENRLCQSFQENFGKKAMQIYNEFFGE